MEDSLIIRPALEADAYRAVELRKLGWQDNYVYPEGGVTSQILAEKLAKLPPSEQDLAYFKDTINNPKDAGKVLVAEINGRVIGVIFYDTLESGNGNIGVFVDREYRGKRVGTRLLQALIERTVNDLEVTIFAQNKSRNLYKQCGFIEEGEQVNHYFDDNTYLPIQRLVLHRS